MRFTLWLTVFGLATAVSVQAAGLSAAPLFNQEQRLFLAGDKRPLGRKLEGLTLEKITFKEATLDSVLEYLRDQADKLSGGEVQVNFVVQLPPGEISRKRVTLELGKIPFTELLRYLGELTGTRFTIESHAVRVTAA